MDADEAQFIAIFPKLNEQTEQETPIVITPQLKQFSDLTADDFASYPVWIGCTTVDYDEEWYDETDEETFRPWTGQLPVSPEEGMLFVRSRLILADGRSFIGFLTPQHDIEPMCLGIIQPQLFLPSGVRQDFWDGAYKRTDAERKHIYEELGNDPNSIFPINFHADDGLATGHVSGSIPGFCFSPMVTVNVYH